MGALSYKSYWKDQILDAFKNHKTFATANYDITIRDVSRYTKI